MSLCENEFAEWSATNATELCGITEAIALRIYFLCQFSNVMNHHIQYLTSGTDTIILMLGQLTVFLFAGSDVIAGTLTIGEFTLISTYFNMVIGAVRYFYSIGTATQTALVSCTRLENILREPVEKVGRKRITTTRTIDVRELYFKYEDGVSVLSGVNCSFCVGHILVIVGANGAGKSTLLHTIAGLHEGNYSGIIEYDGVPISQLDMNWMRKEQIGFVPQVPGLPLSGVYENLLYGREQSNILEDINCLCLKLELDITLIENSTFHQPQYVQKLSGGERVKIATIRELLKHPRIVILDEPTTALDAHSVEKLVEFFTEIKKNSIVIVASHDPRMISISDSVLNLGE